MGVGSLLSRLCCRYLRGETPAMLLKTRLKCCTVAKPVREAILAISISVVSSNYMAVFKRQVCSSWRKEWPVETWMRAETWSRLNPIASATSWREFTCAACCWM